MAQPPPPGPGYGPPPGQGYGPPPAQPGQAFAPPQSQVQWMQAPAGAAGCPPGLEYLTQIDQVLVHQIVELLEAFTGWETQNRYVIKNSLGQQVYYAFEESDVCMRQCCGPSRGFIIHIVDNMQREVIRVNREFKCCAGCCWCACSDGCSLEVSIEAPVGQVVGYVRQSCSAWVAQYDIMDSSRNTVLTIEGPCCICNGPCCCFDQVFQLKATDGVTNVGSISKQYSGFIKEMYTDADNFGVTFPLDLDAKIKAVVVGAVFLIDFMFFEQQQNNN